MSAPLMKTKDPRYVNTREACWVRRAVTGDGRGLYAVEGSCGCPEFLLVSLTELAEVGIVGSADVLPVPMGPQVSMSSAPSGTTLTSTSQHPSGGSGEHEARLPERFNSTPSEIDAFLRTRLAKDAYLRFQQAIGEHALAEAVEDAGTVRASADNDGLYNANWREGWDDAIERVSPDHNGPCPSELVRFPALSGPLAAWPEEEPAGVPCSKCGDPVYWVKSTNSDGGFWRHRVIPGRVLDHFGEVAGTEGPHCFEGQFQTESDAKRRFPNCKHCGQERTAPLHVEAGDR